MAKKEIVQVNLAAANPNLSPATRFASGVRRRSNRPPPDYRGGWQRRSKIGYRYGKFYGRFSRLINWGMLRSNRAWRSMYKAY
jgi:hypothetical protein